MMIERRSLNSLLLSSLPYSACYVLSKSKICCFYKPQQSAARNKYAAEQKSTESAEAPAPTGVFALKVLRRAEEKEFEKMLTEMDDDQVWGLRRVAGELGSRSALSRWSVFHGDSRHNWCPGSSTVRARGIYGALLRRVNFGA
eukprot:368719_1